MAARDSLATAAGQKQQFNGACAALVPHLGWLLNVAIGSIEDDIRAMEDRAMRDDHFGRPRAEGYEWRMQRSVECLAALKVIKDLQMESDAAKMVEALVQWQRDGAARHKGPGGKK